MFVTTYSKTTTKRKGPQAGKTVTECCVYRTKSLTSMHKHIHQTCQNAETRLAPKRVITDFIVGMPLEKAIVTGGFIVNPDMI